MSDRPEIDQQNQPDTGTPLPADGAAMPAFLQHGAVDADRSEAASSGQSAETNAADEVAEHSIAIAEGAAGQALAATNDADTSIDAKDGAEAVSGIESAADTARSLITEGVAGVREARAAKRAHADAREHLELLERTIAAREEELAHRRHVAEHFDAIVAEQRERRAAAAKSKAEAERNQAEHAAQAASLKDELERMREADGATEKRLKSALDAAEAKEASARESGSRLQRRVDDAERNLARTEQERTEGIAAAERAIKSTQEHLDALKSEYAEIQRNPSANPAAYTVRSGELSSQISDAAEAVRLAREELPRIDAETAAAIEQARAMLAEAQRPIAAAKQSFEEILAEADRARDAHAEARSQAEERQKELRRRISEQEKAAREQEKAAEAAVAEDEDAQATLAEAQDIHAHPEQTEALAGALAADRMEREQQLGEVEQLAAAERAVRERTRTARVRLIAAAGVAVLAIACGIALIIAMS